ncbi:MAG TPA: hypothetical protein VLG92_02225 [Candidatus Saccharimonadia bacterium]|nr:hypothetical protein [Candidatus Saccharimonadia bacterium]
MSEYQPGAAPTIDGLKQTLEAVYAAGGLVVGSIGRAAIFAHMGLDPHMEFTERARLTKQHEELLAKPDGTPRDVDVIGPYDFTTNLPELPHPVDPTIARVLMIVKQESGQWDYVDFSSAVHTLNPDCFTPIQCEFEGISCVTVRPATHLILARSFSKYTVGRNLLIDHLPPDEWSFLDSGAYGPLWSPYLRRKRT